MNLVSLIVGNAIRNIDNLLFYSFTVLDLILVLFNFYANFINITYNRRNIKSLLISYQSWPNSFMLMIFKIIYKRNYLLVFLHLVAIIFYF